MERGSAVLVEPIPGIEWQQFGHRSFGQIGRLVDDEASGLHASLAGVRFSGPRAARAATRLESSRPDQLARADGAIAIAAAMRRRAVEAALFSIAGATLLLFIGIHNSWDTITSLVLDASASGTAGKPRRRRR